jgi:hypothetical protein
MLVLPRRFKSQPQYAAPFDLASPILAGVSNAIILYGDAQAWLVNRAADSQLSSLIPNPTITGGGVTDYTEAGPALEFDGSSTYLDFGVANIPTVEFTLLWGGVFDANDSPRGFIDCTDNGVSGWNIYQGGGNTMYFNNSSYPAGNPSTGWTPGQFFHGALRNKGGVSADWFRNGAKVASGTGVSPAAPTLPLWIGRLKVGGLPYIKGRFSYLYLVDKFLDDDTLSRVPANPWLILQQPRRIFLLASTASGVNLTGAASAQGNASSTGATTQAQSLLGANSSEANTVSSASISQSHVLSGANAAQGNVAGTSAIALGYALAGAASAQGNIASSTAVTQNQQLTGAASAQSNASSTGLVTQGHTLAVQTSAQQNSTASGAITQGAAFTGASCNQVNAAGTGGITQGHAVTGSAATQGNTSATLAITQDHALGASGSSQANVGSAGAVTLGAANNLTAAASVQANDSNAGSITQAHILVHAPSVQDNVAAASAIVQAHLLAGSVNDQANTCSSGAISQTSGIPPVDGPAGSGPRLRVAYGQRPAMRNTSRPRQLR